MFQHLSVHNPNYLEKKITSLLTCSVSRQSYRIKSYHLLLVPFCKALFSLQTHNIISGKFLHGKKAAKSFYTIKKKNPDGNQSIGKLSYIKAFCFFKRSIIRFLKPSGSITSTVGPKLNTLITSSVSSSLSYLIRTI